MSSKLAAICAVLPHMHAPRRATLIGCIVVLAFDGVGAIAASALDFPYVALSPVSLLIYATTAFIAARAHGSVAAGVWAGLAVAGTDATLGWWLSWTIGPGEPDSGDRGAAAVASTALIVAASGALVGLASGLAARRRARPA